MRSRMTFISSCSMWFLVNGGSLNDFITLDNVLNILHHGTLISFTISTSWNILLMDNSIFCYYISQIYLCTFNFRIINGFNLPIFSLILIYFFHNFRQLFIAPCNFKIYTGYLSYKSCLWIWNETTILTYYVFTLWR